MIRQFFRFDLAPDRSTALGARHRRNGRGGFAPRFFAILAALLALTPVVGAPLRASSLQTPRLATPLVSAPLLRTSDSSPAAGTSEGAPQGAESPGKAAAKSEAAEAWDAVKDTRNPALLEAYIKRFGSTFFADIAKARLDELKATAAKPFPPVGVPPSASARPVQTLTIRPPPPAPADGIHERAVLYEEELDNPRGQQVGGTVLWSADPIKAEGKPDDLAVHADIEIPSRGLRMTMSLRRNLDPALPASHLIELSIQVPNGFASGGVSSVPGVLMKSNEAARGTPLAGLAVKVTDGFFLDGLANAAAADRERNLQLLLERSWFDIPMVYTNQHRAIMAIEKGASGERVFRTVFTAWGQYPGAAPTAALPEGAGGHSGRDQ